MGKTPSGLRPHRANDTAFCDWGIDETICILLWSQQHKCVTIGRANVFTKNKARLFWLKTSPMPRQAFKVSLPLRKIWCYFNNVGIDSVVKTETFTRLRMFCGVSSET